MDKIITALKPDNYSRSCSSKKEWSGSRHVKAYLSVIDDIAHRRREKQFA